MKVDPFELPKQRCSRTCDHHSRCIQPENHEPNDYHVTEHGCVCLDLPPGQIQRPAHNR